MTPGSASLRRRLRWIGLCLALLVVKAASFGAETEEGFKSLFNGKDLGGWAGDAGIWSVKDGAITGVTKAEPKLTHNTFLVYTNGDVADFELRLSYRIVNGNSGIQYRSRLIRQGPFGPVVGGYQADFEAGKQYSGILYEEQGRGILAQRGQKTVIRADGDKPKVEVTGNVGDSEAIQAAIKHEDWNDYVVIANGNHLQHFINGRLTVDVTDEMAAKAAKSGVLALQVHVGPPMTVQFNNIRLKTLAATAQAKGADRTDGAWGVAAMEANGETLSADTFEGLKLTVEGDKYSVDKGGEIDRGTFSVDATKSPKQMDIRPETGPGAGRTILAIYEFSGDTMRVCYALEEGAGRPASFKTASGSGLVMITYKRK